MRGNNCDNPSSNGSWSIYWRNCKAICRVPFYVPQRMNLTDIVSLPSISSGPSIYGHISIARNLGRYILFPTAFHPALSRDLVRGRCNILTFWDSFCSLSYSILVLLSLAYLLVGSSYSTALPVVLFLYRFAHLMHLQVHLKISFAPSISQSSL